MSIVNADQLSATKARPQLHTANGAEVFSDVENVVKTVGQKIAPVWPLQDYVAVNPYLGFVDQEFLTARRSLRTVSDL